MTAAVPQAREALLTGQLGLDDPTLFIQHGILNGKYVDAADGQTFTVDSESPAFPALLKRAADRQTRPPARSSEHARR